MDKKIDMASVVERIFNLGKSAGEDLAMAEADNLEKQAIIDRMGREIYELEKKSTKQREQLEQHLMSAENALAEKDLIITELQNHVAIQDADIKQLLADIKNKNTLLELANEPVRSSRLRIEKLEAENESLKAEIDALTEHLSHFVDTNKKVNEPPPDCLGYDRDSRDDRLPECKAEYGDKTRTSD